MKKCNSAGNRLLCGLILWLTCGNLLFGQQLVTGTVTDAQDNSPLIGASVYLKGTTIGTTTDMDGKYSIQTTSPSDVIVFQYVGYQPQEVQVRDQKVINVALVVETKLLDELVVIGYGTVKKKDLTGSVSVVSAAELKKSNMTSLGSALQGRAAGVVISNTSGNPGASVSIRVRGVGSINRGAQPLVVIDGIPVGTGGGALTGLNPEDIESVQVLKDASAAAIYGTEGANGVILIQTKKGSSGAPVVTFRVQSGFAQLPKRMDILNADEYCNYYQAAYEEYNRTHPQAPRTMPLAYTPERRAEFGNISTDWQDLITVKQAWNQNYYLSASGGNEKATYMLSGNYLEENGVLITTWRRALSLKANTDFKITDKFRIGENISFGTSQNRNQADQQGNPWVTAAIASPLMPVYNPDARGGYQGPDEYITGTNERTNTYAELMLNKNTGRGNSFFSSLYAELDLLKGLTFKNTLGLMYNNSRGTTWRPVYDLAQRSNPTNFLQESSYEGTKIVWDEQLTYTNQFGLHNITATAVHSMQKSHSDYIQASNSNFQYENLQVLGQGDPLSAAASQYKGDVRFESYLARLIYDYNSRYFLTASVRRDGSSRFGKNNRWGTFPSVSVAWKFNEDLLKNLTWLDMAKVRFGYGQTGNADIGDYLYDAYISGSMEHVYTLGIPERAVFGAAPFYNIPSPNVKWESVNMTNFGIDVNMFGNKIQASIEYYNKLQDNLLVQLPLPLISGMSGDATPPWVNLGKMHNRGLEALITYKHSAGDFRYEITGNLTTISNKVDYLPAGDIIEDYNTALVGHAIGGIYGYVAERILQESDFVTDENGHAVMNADGTYTPLFPKQQDRTSPGDIKFKDLNKDGTVNELDRTLIGKVIPDLVYGLTFNATYKAFDFSFAFLGEQGVDVYNYYRSRAGLASGDNTSKDENKLREVLNYWTPDNPVKNQTRISITDENNNGRTSSWWIEDGSFLRLRDIQLGFTLPENLSKKLSISRLRIYAGATNLLTLTKYSGYDPEVRSSNILSTNIDGGNYPVPRSFTFGVTVDF